MRLFERTSSGPAPGAPDAGPGSYDTVDVRALDGAVQRMTRSQFESQPLASRIRILVEGAAVFFRGDVVVPPSEALKTSR